MVNPWLYYRIPDLNPHGKDEEWGCLAGMIGFAIASIILILLDYVACKHMAQDESYPYGLAISIGVIHIIIYPILIISLMKLGFKIVDSILKKQAKC